MRVVYATIIFLSLFLSGLGIQSTCSARNFDLKCSSTLPQVQTFNLPNNQTPNTPTTPVNEEYLHPNEALPPTTMSDKIATYANSLGSSMKSTFGKFFNSIQRAASSGASEVEEKVKIVSEIVSESASKAGGKTKEFISDNAIEGINILKEKAENLGEKVKNLFQATSTKLQEIGNSVEPKNLDDAQVNSVDIDTKEMVTEPSTRNETMRDSVKSMKEKVLSYLNKVKEGAKSIMPAGIMKESLNIGDKIGNIPGFFSDTGHKIYDNLKDIPSSFKDKVQSLMPSAPLLIVDKIKDFGRSFSRHVGDIGSKVNISTNYISQKKDEWLESLGSFSGKIGQSFGYAGGKIWGIGSSVIGGFKLTFDVISGLFWKIIIGFLIILGIYVYMQIKPFISILFSLFSLCRWRRKKEPATTRKSAPVFFRAIEPSISSTHLLPKLDKEDFQIGFVSLNIQKVEKDRSSYFLKFNLYYEIAHFPAIKGDILLKFSTFSLGSLKQSTTFKVPIGEFMHKAIWKGCSFEDPLDKNIEEVKVRLCIDFKSDIGQYLSIRSDDFTLAVK